MTKPKRLKIGFVVDDSFDRPDGVQQYVYRTGAWLSAQGHEVHYLASTTTRQDVPHIHELTRNVGVRFNGNNLRTPLPASRDLIRRLLDREQFDVLHVQMPYSPFLAGRVIAAAGSETAVVGTFHILPRTKLAAVASKALAVWCQRTLRQFDSVTSVSPAVQDFAKRAFGIMSHVIPIGISLEEFQVAQPFPKKQKWVANILFLGRLVPRKGCKQLLLAVEQLARDRSVPPFHLTVCGKGPLEDDLHRFVKEHKLTRYVTFRNSVSEKVKPRYYASADITVFPSMGGEGFGIVLVEAMASGESAVIAGENGGYRSVLEACPAPVLFDPKDVPALATLIRTLLTDHAMRRHIADWQHHHSKQFDIARTGQQITRMYLSALRARRNMR